MESRPFNTVHGWKTAPGAIKLWPENHAGPQLAAERKHTFGTIRRPRVPLLFNTDFTTWNGKKKTWIQTKPNTTGSHIPPLPNSTFKKKPQTTAAKVHLLVAWARSEWDLVVSQVDPPDLGATHWCANAHRPVAILARSWNNCNPWRVCQGRSKAQGPKKWMAIMAFFLHDAKGSMPKGKIEVIWIFFHCGLFEMLLGRWKTVNACQWVIDWWCPISFSPNHVLKCLQFQGLGQSAHTKSPRHENLWGWRLNPWCYSHLYVASIMHRNVSKCWNPLEASGKRR